MLAIHFLRFGQSREIFMSCVQFTHFPRVETVTPGATTLLPACGGRAAVLIAPVRGETYSQNPLPCLRPRPIQQCLGCVPSGKPASLGNDIGHLRNPTTYSVRQRHLEAIRERERIEADRQNLGKLTPPRAARQMASCTWTWK